MLKIIWTIIRKVIIMEMHNPPHPGRILKNIYLKDCNLSISAFALKIGVSRNTASELINGKNGISAEMALKLAKAFKKSTGFTVGLILAPIVFLPMTAFGKAEYTKPEEA